jgi:hypothetical protein
VQSRNLLQPRRAAVRGPRAEQLPALVPDRRVGQIARAADPQPLEQRLVAHAPLEPRPRILDQAVEDEERAQLAVDVAVLELLADAPRGLGGACGLELDDFDELKNAGEVLLFVRLGGQVLDRDGDGGVGMFLVACQSRYPAAMG